MKKSKTLVQVQVPMLREVYDGLGDAAPETVVNAVNVADVVSVMNTKAAERDRRVFEAPWLERVEESFQGSDEVVALVFVAQMEPA